jgi:hypothetical protein
MRDIGSWFSTFFYSQTGDIRVSMSLEQYNSVVSVPYPVLEYKSNYRAQ